MLKTNFVPLISHCTVNANYDGQTDEESGGEFFSVV